MGASRSERKPSNKTTSLEFPVFPLIRPFVLSRRLLAGLTQYSKAAAEQLPGCL
jgi:hypothetical protein